MTQFVPTSATMCNKKDLQLSKPFISIIYKNKINLITLQLKYLQF